MKRREFLLKSMVFTVSGFVSGLFPIRSNANSSADKSKKESGFYKIDAFSHFVPASFLDYLRSLGGPPHSLQPLIKAFPELSDVYGLQPRLKMMEDQGIDISIIFPQPDLENGLGPVFMTPGKALSAAMFINDYMAKMCEESPRFKFTALMPLNNKEDLKTEFDRALKLPGMVGVGINTGPFTRPPDDQVHMALYELASTHKVPIWVHLNRSAIYPDYMTDPLQPSPPFPPNTRVSRVYNWLNFGFLNDGSVAMMRIVAADIFRKFPGIKIIMHQRGHLIPLYKDRIKMHFMVFQGINPPPVGMPKDFDIDYSIDQLRNFYVDAICSGEDTDLLMRSVRFFGADHVLFATDTAYSPNGGRYVAQMTTKSILNLQLDKTDLQNIFAGNIQRLINSIVR